MTRRIVMQWNLRQVMAARGIFQTSDLVPMLAERDVHLSRQFVHRLVTKTPQRVNMEVLAALCDLLDCEPNDLLQPVVETVKVAKTGTDAGPGIGDLRPIRPRSAARTKGEQRSPAPAQDYLRALRQTETVPATDPGQARVRDLRAAVRTHIHDLPGVRRDQGVGVLRRAPPPRVREVHRQQTQVRVREVRPRGQPARTKMRAMHARGASHRAAD